MPIDHFFNEPHIFLIAAAAFVAVVTWVVYYFARRPKSKSGSLSSKDSLDRQTLSETSQTPSQIPTGLHDAADFKVQVPPGTQKDADLEVRVSPGPPKPEHLKSKTSKSEAPKRLKTLEEALAGTRSSLWGRISSTFTGTSTPSDDLQQIEEVLFTSDLGPQTAQHLLEKVGDRLSRSEKTSAEKVREMLKSEMLAVFPENLDLFDRAKDMKGRGQMVVWMVVGVNGAGKTTTIGKLASLAQLQGLRPMIVAGDTFRAAADSQLRVWSERSGSLYYSSENTKDPSAVAYQGLEKAQSLNVAAKSAAEKSGVAVETGVDIVLIDTAGRLHTQENLMAELQKMKRVMTKIIPEAPHEVIIVLDANSGQNALEQARQFHKILGLSGAILTKLDGTSKGGVAVGLVSELGVPIRFIGIGEAIEDLRVFSAQDFVDSIV